MDLKLDLIAPRRAASGAADLARGVARLLAAMGYVPLDEVPLSLPRRVDVLGLGPKGEMLVVEIKSGPADFRADQKWPDYLAFCDSFYFGVGEDFPLALLPPDAGIIVADRFGAEIRRPAPPRRMNGNARRAQTLRFARLAGQRLRGLVDPGGLG